jgi:hypothetical protein
MNASSSFWLLLTGALVVGASACVFDHVEECEERLTCSGGAPAIPVTASATGGGGAGGSGGANAGGADRGGGGAG